MVALWKRGQRIRRGYNTEYKGRYGWCPYICAHYFPLFWGLAHVDKSTHQAGLFSAVLTAFIIDRSQNIQQTPAQQSAFFQQQSLVLLDQISKQLSSLGAQTPLLSNVSLSGPTVSPSASDIRVNIFWFTSLVFSLCAALLATLVQRWARDYMRIFRRYSHPLKIARIRQYLHEGVEGWYMPAAAEAVPGLVHISLFLFLLGLTDFLLNTYTVVGKFTVFPISFCVTLYVFSTVAPVVNPKSPYRTSFSTLVWCIYRKLRKRSCNNRFGLDPKPLSSNMADGQMQLAMEKNDGRKGRDERAIRWLVNNLTEDVEMESLASGIPGSFDAKWGVEVWKSDPATKKDESTAANPAAPQAAPPGYGIRAPRPALQPQRRSTISSFLGRTSAHPDPDTILQPPSPPPACGEVDDELCQRLQRLFETCNHRGSFMNDDEWRRRSRACVETAASFVFCLDADIISFGKIGKLLSDLGSAEKTREVSATSLNRPFTTRWTCLSLVATRKMLNSPQLQQYASGTILTLGTFCGVGNFTPFETALRNAQKIDEQFVAACDYVEKLLTEFNGLPEEGRREERVEGILRLHEPDLKKIQEEADDIKLVDERICDLQNQIDGVTYNLSRQLPGVTFDDITGPTPLAQVFDFLANPVRSQLIYMSPRLLGLCTLMQRRSSHGYRETIKVLKAVEKTLPSLRSVVRRHHLMERQLWRLQDLSIGGAFGFTLELYFLSLKKILSTFTPPPREIHITFYIGAFKAITSDWERFKDSLGTQQIILNLVCDMAVRDRGMFSNFVYPEYITKELLELLGKMVKGQTNRYIDAALNELRDVGWRLGDRSFRDSALKTILDHRPPSDPS